jgi:ATP-dependent DNA helicase RecG
MADESWIDQALSTRLPILRAQGEGQELEFKGELPKNAQELGREVAAFATSNAGLILVGVTDEGNLFGIPNGDRPEVRDELSRRVSGVCRAHVKPAVVPEIAFAVEDGRTVMVVSIKKGSEPVYYNNGRPYIRDHSESRPAEPHEVKYLVKSFLVSSGEVVARKDDREESFLQAIAVYASEILFFALELNDRLHNPWMRDFQDRFIATSDNLRGEAAEPMAQEREIRAELRCFADTCEAVGRYDLGPDEDSWAEFEGLVRDAMDQARRLLDELRRLGLSFGPDDLRAQLRRSLSILEDLTSRAERMIASGRVEAVREEAAGEGFSMLRALLIEPEALEAQQHGALMRLATTLHLMETEAVMADGGAGERRTLKVLRECVGQLSALA